MEIGVALALSSNRNIRARYGASTTCPSNLSRLSPPSSSVSRYQLKTYMSYNHVTQSRLGNRELHPSYARTSDAKALAQPYTHPHDGLTVPTPPMVSFGSTTPTTSALTYPQCLGPQAGPSRAGELIPRLLCTPHWRALSYPHPCR